MSRLEGKINMQRGHLVEYFHNYGAQDKNKFPFIFYCLKFLHSQ